MAETKLELLWVSSTVGHGLELRMQPGNLIPSL
jgi:hypothetical protein